MKVLQISNYFYPHIGGIEQVARDFANAAAGVEQKIFCFNHEKADVTDVVDGVEIIRAGTFCKVASQSLSFSYRKRLKKVMDGFAPDVVVFHYPNPFAAHYLLKILKKFPACKLVLYWHLDIIKQKFLAKFFEGQNKKLLERADAIVATSENYLSGSKYLPHYRQKCVVIPNCVSESRMQVTAADLENAEKIREKYRGKTICLAAGRHVPYKGIEYLVRASKLLDDRFAVFITGDGPLTESLKTLAEGDGKITFLGRTSDEDLKAYMIACDIFCFPSVTKNEAFGIALAEAMSYGKPSVTFTIEGSGVNYVSLDRVTGIEVENGNVQAFAGAMRELAENDGLRKKMGEAAGRRVAENFTFKIFSDKVNELIEQLR